MWPSTSPHDGYTCAHRQQGQATQGSAQHWAQGHFSLPCSVSGHNLLGLSRFSSLASKRSPTSSPSLSKNYQICSLCKSLLKTYTESVGSTGSLLCSVSSSAPGLEHAQVPSCETTGDRDMETYRSN